MISLSVIKDFLARRQSIGARRHSIVRPERKSQGAFIGNLPLQEVKRVPVHELEENPVEGLEPGTEEYTNVLLQLFNQQEEEDMWAAAGGACGGGTLVGLMEASEGGLRPPGVTHLEGRTRKFKKSVKKKQMWKEEEHDYSHVVEGRQIGSPFSPTDRLTSPAGPVTSPAGQSDRRRSPYTPDHVTIISQSDRRKSPYSVLSDSSSDYDTCQPGSFSIFFFNLL